MFPTIVIKASLRGGISLCIGGAQDEGLTADEVLGEISRVMNGQPAKYVKTPEQREAWEYRKKRIAELNDAAAKKMHRIDEPERPLEQDWTVASRRPRVDVGYPRDNEGAVL